MILGVVLVFALLGWAIGSQKGRCGYGLVAGTLLGPIGLVLVAVARPSKRHREATTRTQIALYAQATGAPVYTMPIAAPSAEDGTTHRTIVERYVDEIEQGLR